VDSRVPVAAARLRLFRLIRDTPHLDWLLLTKRPAYAAGWLDRLAWYADGERGGFSPYLTEPGRGAWYDRPLPNLWIGTSVEDQAAADERIPHVLRIPAAVRFLSCEPLIGPVDLGRWVRAGGELLDWTPDGDAPPGDYNPVLRQWETRPDDGGIAWVIVGGESGHGARPMHPQWARSLRDQCQAAGVAFFMKQWGAWAPYDGEWIDAGMTVYPDGAAMQRIGKVAAGRLLDGREWSDVPTLRQEPR
jgi:protein gp37